MPCYDPPPPWEGRHRKSSEEAVRLLCGMIGVQLAKGGPVEREFLVWYLGHRKIDLEIATTPWYGDPNAAEAERINAEIAMLEKILA